MSVKIRNSEEFNKYLKVLAEESVRAAYELNEQPEDEDPLFGDDEEGGDEGDEDSLFGGNEEKPSNQAKPQENPQGEEPSVEEPEPEPERQRVEIRPTPLTLELGHVSSEGLIATLNMIRAGRSFKEPEVATELRKYFEEQLNDAERLALGTMLAGIRDVVGGEPAEEATDPGDENVEIDATDQEKAENMPSNQQQPREPSQQPQPQQGGRGYEDTTPPIVVGPRNESIEEDFRAHIRSILNG